MTNVRPTTVDEMLAEARATVRRVSPEQADAELRAGALLIDIRPQGLRERDGVVPGSRIIDRPSGALSGRALIELERVADLAQAR